MRGLLFLVLFCIVTADESVVFLLDTSGSMQGQEQAMVDSVNAVLGEMADTLETTGWKGTFAVQIHTFSHDEKRLLTEAPLSARPRVTLQQYRCNGGTPLFDAIGATLAGMRDNSTLIIATDGEDTTSRNYRAADIKKMLEVAQKERDIHVTYVYKGDEAFTQAEGIAMGHAASSSGSAFSLGYSFINAVPCGAFAPTFRHLGAVNT